MCELMEHLLDSGVVEVQGGAGGLGGDGGAVQGGGQGHTPTNGFWGSSD